MKGGPPLFSVRKRKHGKWCPGYKKCPKNEKNFGNAVSGSIHPVFFALIAKPTGAIFALTPKVLLSAHSKPSAPFFRPASRSEQRHGDRSVDLPVIYPSEIRLPDGIVRIGAWAFAGCTDLTETEIPDGAAKNRSVSLRRHRSDKNHNP